MNIQNFKIFDKNGSPLNWTASPFINLVFNSTTGKDAEGFLITDVSGFVTKAEIVNGGYAYTSLDTISYSYTLGTGIVNLPSTDASIVTTDVSIFNPEGVNSTTIVDVSIRNDLSTNFIYPATTYAGAIFLKPVSQGLVETEHLFIFEETSMGYVRPIDTSNNFLVFEFIGDDNEIQFFEVNENTSEITWSDVLVVDTSVYAENTPIQLNIGFRSQFEGIFERTLRIYHLVGNTLYTLADIVVNAESIGEDERFRSLIANFGLPDPKDIQQIFKETDINEDLPDWQILNYKSKHIILEYDKIMPFIGTYKALINAIKWLGYDDVFIREWFLNVKENKKISLLVPFDATDRTQTILMFNADQRKTFKKLNQLSLNYCITRETGAIDDWGTPITENCYTYNLKEVYIKLFGLKQWLERNIIGVNCRITDLTGEGIYFERIQNLAYATDNVGYDLDLSQTLTPYSPDEKSELIQGDASIRLTFLELTRTQIQDLPYRFIDMAESAWTHTDPSVLYSLTDPSYLADPSSFLLLGATFQYPFVNISDIMWRLSVEKDFAGVIGDNLVTNPLFVLENEIRFYNIFDSSSIFYNSSTNLTLILEKAYLKDPSIDEWTNSTAYSIYPNASVNGFILESSIGNLNYFSDYVYLVPDASGKLQYAVDNNYKVPLLSFQYFKCVDDSNNLITFGDKVYYLDVLDGKIQMDAGNVLNSSDNTTMYINWQYDTSLEEQMITVNVTYDSPRMELWQVDPSIYYWADPSGLTGGDASSLIIDNSIYKIHVNHIGNYNIELFAWDSYNTLFHNQAKETYPVYIKTPTLYTLIDQECIFNCPSTYVDLSLNDVSILVSNNATPIYDRIIPLQGLELKFDVYGYPYLTVPSITYFQDVPEPNSLNKFYNLTERVTEISGTNITVDPDYQKFYAGDSINLVKFDKGKYSFIEEASSYIVSTSGSDPIVITLDQIPAAFTIEASSDIYILNNTYRDVENVSNVGSNLVLDVSGSPFIDNQLIGIIVTDGSTGHECGASYRIISVDGSTYTFDNSLPQFFIDNPGKYSIKVKHAFSSYADFTISTDEANEMLSQFNIYLKTSYCQEYYLDSTFVLINVLFDQDIVNQQWYNVSDNLINSTFYYYVNPISVDISTLVILRALYDCSTYLLNQKNIWQVINHDSSTILFKVFNESVPYIFNESGTYDVECTSYDSFGNAITKKYEGLIEVI